MVVKSEHRLYLLRGSEVVKSYRVALGRQPRGTKLYQGDGRTPEGRYVLDGRNAGSNFYRALHVSYPNAADEVRARAMGEAAGGLIMVHGLPNERPNSGEEHWMYNWTNGCIAVTNREMDEIWASTELGTPIEIRPEPPLWRRPVVDKSRCVGSAGAAAEHSPRGVQERE